MPLARAFCLGPLLRATRDSRGARRVSDHERLTSRPPFALDLQEIPDIDALDRENPLEVTEYVNDIFSYWFRVEVRDVFARDQSLLEKRTPSCRDAF